MGRAGSEGNYQGTDDIIIMSSEIMDGDEVNDFLFTSLHQENKSKKKMKRNKTMQTKKRRKKKR